MPTYLAAARSTARFRAEHARADQARCIVELEKGAGAPWRQLA